MDEKKLPRPTSLVATLRLFAESYNGDPEMSTGDIRIDDFVGGQGRSRFVDLRFCRPPLISERATGRYGVPGTA